MSLEAWADWPGAAGRAAVLATRHGKAEAIAPALAPLGLRVVPTDAVDTDRFGTFASDVPRPLPPCDTVRAKARAGLASGAWPAAVASEGSYGPHPELPFAAWGEEWVAWVEADSGLTVLGRHAGPAPWAWQRRLAARPELGCLAFPDRAVAVPALAGQPRPDLGVRKGLAPADLPAAWDALDRGEGLWLLADLRAHLCPPRMAAVAAAARDLASRLASRCPACGRPGFGPVESEPGRPCAVCGTPTALTQAVRHGCEGCGLDQRRLLPEGTADPGHCPACNP